ncbi:Serine protease 55, partial [Acanthisitta chloris]
ITAGRFAKAGELPWHVSVQSHGKHICGGTIISASWILTAAHCFEEELPPDLTVVVGGIDLSLQLEEHKPDSLILHENFSRTSMQNDIALILLNSPIKFSGEKIPICLPFTYNINAWQDCWAAGWGNTSAGASVTASHVLQKVPMKLISKKQCLEQIPQLGENMVCAEMKQGETDSCQVDTGGPLVCRSWNAVKWFQIGIIS